MSEKVKSVACVSVAILGAGALIYLFMKYVFALVLPFIVAWGVAFAVRTPAKKLNRFIKAPEKIIRLSLTLTVILTLIAVLGVGIFRLSSEVVKFFSGEGSSAIDGVLTDIASKGGFIGEILGQVGGVIKKAAEELISSMLTSLGRLVSAWVGALPKIFLTLIITVISSLYFAYDLEKINAAIYRVLPRRAASFLRDVKNGAVKVGLRYLKSYSLLMLITFLVMLLGFLILRVRYALLLAILLAVLDLLPVLGVGAALVPWSICELILGNTGMGIGIIILYLCHTVIRQFAEPKILGENLGVHPLLTLILLYVGYSLFGFCGILLGPLAVVLINAGIGKKDSPKISQDSVGQGDDL